MNKTIFRKLSIIACMFFTALSVNSCIEPDYDYQAMVTFDYYNTTDHKIVMSNSGSFFMNKNYLIPPHEHVIIKFSTGMGSSLPLFALIPKTSVLFFDTDYSVEMTDKDVDLHNPCSTDSYEVILFEQYKSKYLFEFVEEDYEYAFKLHNK